jgi:TolB-like protein/Flp pilus assembly protein TadD
MPLTPGTKLGSYEILSALGAGGMGEVYRAKDVKLGRDVAIKVLREELASDSGRLRRFEQEARAASSLNHPNIVTIYDIRLRKASAGQVGEEGDLDYIVMEYVEGKTLREMLGGEPLPTKKLLQFSTQIADGLAKLVPEPSEAGSEARTITKATQEGVVLGTVQYMSPEQAAGHSVDYHSDQFSFGSILYEMATGKLAYQRDTGPVTLAAIMRDEPEPISVLNPRVPAQLTHVIGRCLEKEPQQRYDSTRDLARELASVDELSTVPQAGLPTSRRLPAAGVVGFGLVAVLVVMGVALFTGEVQNWIAGDRGRPPIESIAVLPLENLSGDPGQEYFADGMTDELISQLAQIGALKVISRTSIMQYKEARKPLPEIARELGVDAIVEGTVRRAEGRVRITAQLIQAETDQHLWAQSFERDLHDVLALQSEMARAIASEVQATLTPQEEERLATARPVDPQVQEAYLKGRFHSELMTPSDLTKSIDFLETAIENDPGYGAAYATLAKVYSLLPVYILASSDEGASKAIAMAKRALELDETLEEAHFALGWALSTQFEWTEAEKSFRRGLELNPNSAPGHSYYGWFLTWMGRHEEAIEEQRRALTLDPLSPGVGQRLGASLIHARRYDEAVEVLKRTLALHPNFAFGYVRLSRAYSYKGMYEDALQAHQKAVTLTNDRRIRVSIARLYAVMGDQARARQLLAEFHEADEQGPRALAATARVYVALGDKDKAFQYLEKAYQMGDPNIILLKVAPDLDPIRDDPRYHDLLRRMNLPQS